MLLKHQMVKHGNFLFKYRGELPLILLPTALVVFYFEVTGNPGFDWKGFMSWYQWVCLAVVALGQGIRFGTLGFTAPNTSGRNIHNQIADVVNSTGMYSIVRHPLYVGNFFMALGTAMLSCNAWFVLVYMLLFWVYYERIIFAEENFISEKFGPELNKWAEHVPTFIPSFRNYRKSDRLFNGRKLIRQEINGIGATVSIFLFFQIVLNLALYRKPFIGWELWSIAWLATLALYLVVRYLKKKTKVLQDRV